MRFAEEQHAPADRRQRHEIADLAEIDRAGTRDDPLEQQEGDRGGRGKAGEQQLGAARRGPGGVETVGRQRDHGAAERSEDHRTGGQGDAVAALRPAQLGEDIAGGVAGRHEQREQHPGQRVGRRQAAARHHEDADTGQPDQDTGKAHRLRQFEPYQDGKQVGEQRRKYRDDGNEADRNMVGDDDQGHVGHVDAEPADKGVVDERLAIVRHADAAQRADGQQQNAGAERLPEHGRGRADSGRRDRLGKAGIAAPQGAETDQHGKRKPADAGGGNGHGKTR